MTVRELRELLLRFDDDAMVYEDRQSELRLLRSTDIESYPTGTGHPIDDEDEQTTGPIVVFGAWS